MAFEAWPADALESVPCCPYCGGVDRTLAFEAVQDWAFGCAPGLWNYWGCDHCHALILHPRPTPASIGKAYARYYTHAGDRQPGRLGAFKQRLRNEHWSQVFTTSIVPRLGLPRWLGWSVTWLKPWIAEPFGLRQWVQLPKGLLIDVGCGNGDKLKLAAQLGWQTLGIELDAAAVAAAQAQGLAVVQGGYELLANYPGRADCVVCSHVLEHVHQPLNLLRLLLASLAPNGVLLLSAPNASSDLRRHYGENWRGLEAPRHLAIPDAQWLTAWMQAQGFECTQVPSHALETAIESERIRRRALSILPVDVDAAKTFMRSKAPTALAQQDVVQLVCVRAKA
jgi:2-polyprenyl-3-methyl-5-hydroxy-6-metoxy-1,4-benzoquinol methylase